VLHVLIFSQLWYRFMSVPFVLRNAAAVAAAAAAVEPTAQHTVRLLLLLLRSSWLTRMMS
jgi:hypothetical protein